MKDGWGQTGVMRMEIGRLTSVVDAEQDKAYAERSAQDRPQGRTRIGP